MRKPIVCSAIICFTLATAAQAHEPIALRLLREYQQQSTRLRAEAERQRKQYAQWQREWQRQEQARREALTRKPESLPRPSAHRP